jgi:predicted RNA-binding Zn-ribbon protein involved in translation (DUF1610 family)
VEDLRRFFRLLVRNLAATGPGRLSAPIQLEQIRSTVLPYRAYRRVLQLESSEEYELVLIRLCAGQGGYAQIRPNDVQAEFAAEALSSNPDLTIVLRHPDAALVLNNEHLANAMDPEPGLAFAPPDQRLSHPVETMSKPSATQNKPTRTPAGKHPAPANCLACGEKLPAGLAVNFCPHCGESQMPRQCPECQTELEPSWRHCVGCGRAVVGS